MKTEQDKAKHAEYMRAYYAANKEKWAETTKARRAGNLAQYREKDRVRYRKEKQVIRARQAKYKRTARLRKYGLTDRDYEKLLAEQGGVCVLCGHPPRKYRLIVDHCHETGRVRGLLCNGCNLSLGRLGDNAESLYHVIQYLEGK